MGIVRKAGLQPESRDSWGQRCLRSDILRTAACAGIGGVNSVAGREDILGFGQLGDCPVGREHIS